MSIYGNIFIYIYVNMLLKILKKIGLDHFNDLKAFIE